MLHRSVELLADPSGGSGRGSISRNSNSFAYGNTGNQFDNVGTNRNRQQLNTSNTNNFNQYNSKAEALVNIVPDEVKQDLDIKIDYELNSFYVSGPSANIERFKKFIRQIDKPVPVVLIEVMIIEVSKSATVETGISWGIGDSPVQTQGGIFPETNITLGAQTINKVIGGFDGFGSFNLGKVVPNFFASIKAMETNGDLKIRSTPKIATLNGHRATFSNGQTSYYAVTQRNIYGTDNPQTSEITNYVPIDAQLGITIKPLVSGDGQVTLDIFVIQSSFGQRIAEDAPPDISSREFSSIIRVQDQDIVVLGGLEEQVKNDSGSSVPLLARVPVIKWLFSKRRREASKAKLTVLIKEITTYLQFGNRYCGIEHTSENGQDRLYATLLKKSKKEVDIESHFEAPSIKNLSGHLPKNGHAVLIINNQHVITKKVQSDKTEDLKLVYKAFPNINLEDFYYEVLQQKTIHFVSICRKKYVEELINEYSSNNISIIDIALGNQLVSSVSNFINDQSITTSNAHISLEDNNITNIDGTANFELREYNINGLKVKNNYLLSLSAALAKVLNNYSPNTNFETYKTVLHNDYKQSRFFSLFLKFGLFFLLGLLMTNFFFFNHYFNGVNTLQQTSQINQTTKNKVLELNESVTKTQKMVEDMLQSSSSKSSFYVNTIILSLPASILLSELNYQPLLKRIKAEQAIESNSNTIFISGTSTNSEQFSKWVTDLETNSWVNKVEILKYEDVSKSKSDFSIKLNITND